MYIKSITQIAAALRASHRCLTRRGATGHQSIEEVAWSGTWQLPAFGGAHDHGEWHCYYNKGHGPKRELPVGSWPEMGGQKYEGSKHSIWAHVIGQNYLPPVYGRTPTGTSRFSLLWSAPTRLWPQFVAFCCSLPVYLIWPAWRRTTTQIMWYIKHCKGDTK